MHILGVKSLAHVLQSKKLNTFQVEAERPHLHSRESKFAMTRQAPHMKSSAESSSKFLRGIGVAIGSRSETMARPRAGLVAPATIGFLLLAYNALISISAPVT
jgi:hypothetical protein